MVVDNDLGGAYYFPVNQRLRLFPYCIIFAKE
jgi:hypothetical protein